MKHPEEEPYNVMKVCHLRRVEKEEIVCLRLSLVDFW